jgi:hypothetical protein
MNLMFEAVVVVAVFAITGGATGQPSGGGATLPSLAAPEPGSETNDEPSQPASQHRSGLRSR